MGGLIGLNVRDEKKISPHLMANCLEVMFIAEVVVIATEKKHNLGRKGF